MSPGKLGLTKSGPPPQQGQPLPCPPFGQGAPAQGREEFWDCLGGPVGFRKLPGPWGHDEGGGGTAAPVPFSSKVLQAELQALAPQLPKEQHTLGQGFQMPTIPDIFF